MNTTSASPAEVPGGAPAATPVLIWDLPVRVFHWTLVLCFAGAWITAESERWRLLHVTLGYTMAGLVAFRIAWGFVGTRYARFASFVRGPGAVLAHVKAMFSRREESHPGHNPIGALAILAVLGLTLVLAGSGWALYERSAGDVFEEVHEFVANALMAVVVVHVAGVLLASRLTHAPLVKAMLTGRKPARPDEAIGSAWRGLAAVMVVAVAGFWWWQWQQAPAPDAHAQATAAQAGQGGKADDDD